MLHFLSSLGHSGTYAPDGSIAKESKSEILHLWRGLRKAHVASKSMASERCAIVAR